MRNKPGRPYSEEVTQPQARTLALIEQIINRNGICPSMQELAKAMGITAASVHEHVDALVRKGWLTRTPRKARSLKVVRSTAHTVEISILGSVAAGHPIHAHENVIGTILVDGALTRGGKCFALRVAGDSMTRAKIHDGDLVVVRQQQVAENGDIIVADLDGAVTCKRLSYRDGRIQLMPENAKFKPIPVGPDDDFRILGKVVAVRKTNR